MWPGDLDLYKPRYTQTYFGIRNRIGILSETYSYASFEDRINVELLVPRGDHQLRGDERRRPSARPPPRPTPSRSSARRSSSAARMVKAKDPVEVVLADVVDERNPYVPDRPMRRRVGGSERVETMPHLGLIEGDRDQHRSAGVRDLVRARTDGPALAGRRPCRRVRPLLRRAARARRHGARRRRTGRTRRHGRAVRAPDGQSDDAGDRERRRPSRRARHQVLQDREGLDLRGRALQDRLVRGGAGRVPGHAQAPDGDGRLGERPSRRCRRVRS